MERLKKSVQDSRTTSCFIVMPHDMNHQGSLFGGVLLQHIDMLAGICATRHSRANRGVTASIDQVNFITPAYEGDFLMLEAVMTYCSLRSMEISVKVHVEQRLTGLQKEICTSYLTFVALGEDNKAITVPELIPNTPEEIIAYKAGELRYRTRKEQRKQNDS